MPFTEERATKAAKRNNITEEELCFEAECIATLRGAGNLAKAFRRNSIF